MLKAPFTVPKAKAKDKNFFEVNKIFIEAKNYVCYTIALKLKYTYKLPWEIRWPLCEEK